MTNSLLQIALISLILCFASGCAIPVSRSSGNPIDPDKVAQIEKGKTTRAEIEAMFGKPISTAMLMDGRRALSYNYSNTKMTAFSTPIPFTGRAQGTIQTQILQIYISKDGVVEDFEFNDNTQKVSGDGMGNTRMSPE